MGPATAFAELLEYPGPDLPQRVSACAGLLSDPEAVAALGRFDCATAGARLPRLEEEYAAAFDLDGGCALYAGHQLFGEDARRNHLLCGLSAEYRRHGFAAPAGELADYLPLLLRYLDTGGAAGVDGEDLELRRDLLAEVVLPAARKLEAALAARAHPWAPVLRALVLTLEGTTA